MLYILVDNTADSYWEWEVVKGDFNYTGAFILGQTKSDFLDDAENIVKDYEYYFDPEEDPGCTFPDFIKDFAPAKYMPGILYSWEKVRAALDDAVYYGLNANTLPPLLTAITGEKWNSETIRGYCQMDRAHLIYKAADYSYGYIEYIESVYFNTGAEICILDDGKEEPKTLEEFYEYGCYGYVPDYSREGIAGWLGTNPENVKLYQPKEIKDYVLEAI